MKFLIYKELQKRILVLDGAMGTLILGKNLTEEDYRGSRFAGWKQPLKGCNDALALTAPNVISSIHEAYLNIGVDIITTNTFGANSLSLADYGLQNHSYDISRAAAALARRVANRLTLQNPSKPRFVAGSIGPTGKSATLSRDFDDMSLRSVTFEDLVDAYTPQVRGLIDGGVDVFLIETVFDALNAKAAIKAIEMAGSVLPVMVSGTISDRSGRILSGQTVEALYTSVQHAPNLLCVGLNCAMGAEGLMPHIEQLNGVAECFVSMHPNAGMPNVMGQYDQTPQNMAQQVEEFLKAGLVNIIGGCCGTTPAHIGALAQLAHKYSPRPLPEAKHITALSGLERFEIVPQRNFVNVGERTNVAGSARFANLIREGDYEGALAVARSQIEVGAQIIDVCMDAPLIDGAGAMTRFLSLAALDPEISRVPVMIDSSEWEVLEGGLQCVQGKSIVNSISLKEGEEEFLRRAAAIRSYGAAAMVMLFDETGQADTLERKTEVAGRAYRLLTEAGFPPEDIIFDPNVLAVATGIEEHNDYGRAFIEACRWIKQNLPYAKVSGGISNLSFSYRGNNPVREAMHSVMLYHAIAAGMDMGIVNPSALQVYSDIPQDLLQLCEDVVLNRRPDATERLTAYAAELKEKGVASGGNAPAVQEWRGMDLAGRLEYALIKGITDHVEADILEAYAKYKKPLTVIEKLLMPAMDKVGGLFGEGKMFLPQVVKSARAMKTAVGVLTPYMEADAGEGVSRGRVLVATVKGDVHDIGKNIASVVMSCNGYAIDDMGVMVEAEDIVGRAVKWGAEALGLSGLITPSLEEMARVVSLMERRGLNIPVLIGGATTSELHTAVMIAPHYSGAVVHVSDASDNVKILSGLLGPDSEQYVRKLKEKQGRLRENYLRRQQAIDLRPLAEARRKGYIKQPLSVVIPRQSGRVVFHDYPIAEVIPYIDWRHFFPAWGIKGKYPELLALPEKGEEARRLFADAQRMLKDIIREKRLKLHASVGIFPASSLDDDIVVWNNDNKKVLLPQLRNQERNKEHNLCLADFILSQQMIHEGDFIGLFTLTAADGLEEAAEKLRGQGDDYGAIMHKLLADRLTEAFAEVMHEYVRRELWGFQKEAITPEKALRGEYRGVRLAFGYPSCPDHSLKREVFDLLEAEQTLPVKLTGNFMISPGESVCGIILSDSNAKYFPVGYIDSVQLEDYARRRAMDVETVRKLIPKNLVDESN